MVLPEFLILQHLRNMLMGISQECLVEVKRKVCFRPWRNAGLEPGRARLAGERRGCRVSLFSPCCRCLSGRNPGAPSCPRHPHCHPSCHPHCHPSCHLPPPPRPGWALGLLRIAHADAQTAICLKLHYQDRTWHQTINKNVMVSHQFASLHSSPSETEADNTGVFDTQPSVTSLCALIHLRLIDKIFIAWTCMNKYNSQILRLILEHSFSIQS